MNIVKRNETVADMPEDMGMEMAKAAIFEIVEKVLSKYPDGNVASESFRHNVANGIFKGIVNEGFVESTKKHDFLGPNDPGDEQHEQSSEIYEYDKKIETLTQEEAEAAWRGTVLHPEYKSEYDEEE